MNLRYIIETVLVAYDPDDMEETAFLEVLKARVPVMKAEDRLRLARQQHAQSSPGTATESPLPPPSTAASRSQGDLPEGRNIYGLLDVVKQGGINHDTLVPVLFDKDTREDRKRAYARVNHWKSKGWLVKTDDGKWVVPQDLAGRLSQLASELRRNVVDSVVASAKNASDSGGGLKLDLET